MSEFFNLQFQSPSSSLKHKLIYVVGASGSGKDSIIQYCCENLFDTLPIPVVVPHRFITRDDTQHEKSLYLNEEEFKKKSAQDGFAMQWQANHFYYGIGKEIDACLLDNCIVVVNGSREYLPTAKQKYGKILYSVSIDVPLALLEKRLYERGRESIEDIQLRIQRHKQLQQHFTTNAVIENTGTIEESSQRLIDIIASAQQQ